jgi:glyoxylase-like metal-dependent hydrolase (beta-lactamase superfamily II)
MKNPIKSLLIITLFIISAVSQAGKLGVYTSPTSGFDTHTFYYDDGKEVTIFDTQFVPSLTEEMVKKIKSETSSPITRVIVTHPNPDKFNGLSYLHGLGVASISSKAVAQSIPEVHDYKKNFWVNVMGAFKDHEYPVLENVQSTFENNHTIKLKSGETISLFQLDNSGVAKTQVVARIDSTGDLIVGDLIHTKAHAWLEGGLVNGTPDPDLAAWVNALSELPALSSEFKDAKVYGGRGEFINVKDAVIEQMSYLNKANSVINDYIIKNNIKNITLSDKKVASELYKDIAQVFSDEFPEYKAPYMIQYSIYGLVGSITH